MRDFLKTLIFERFFSFLYRIVEYLALSIGASHKVTTTLDYRRHWLDFISDEIKAPNSKISPGLWIHGASVGELEDLASFYTSKELLEKAGYNFSQVILTSSSPSAEAFLKKLSQKHPYRYAGPLPPDVTPRMKEFFSYLKPELLVLSQSDLWPVAFSIAQRELTKGCLWLPHKEKSASWAKEYLLKDFVQWVGLRSEYFSNPLHNTKAKFIGSPRIDRILERISLSLEKEHPLWENFKKVSLLDGKVKVLLASAWREDAQVWHQALEKLSADLKNKLEIFVIPHEIKNAEEVAELSALFGNRVVLKEGILLEAYKSFDLAFVGGGFKTGLHNIIEPIAWAIPTLCGADVKKQPEAPLFLKQGSLRTIKNSDELKDIVEKILTDSLFWSTWKNEAQKAQESLKAQKGAATRLASLIGEFS